MRFAYIDSQGKEVGIPTVEALQLRIELGAITEETIFYDASKDRWDPAGEHEIFRTLSREIRERGEEGPRPPTPKVVSSGESVKEDVGGEEDSGDGEESPRVRTSDPFGDDQDPLADTAPPGEVGWVEAELEELHEPEEAPTPPPDSAGDWDVDLGEFGGLELAPDLAAGSGGEPEDAGPTTDAVGAVEGVENLQAAGVEDLDAMDPEAGSPPGAAADTGDGGVDEPAPHSFEDAGEELELERPFAEQHGDESSVASEFDVEFETPLAKLEPGPELGWDEPGDEGPGEGPGREEPEGAGSGEASAVPRRSPGGGSAIDREAEVDPERVRADAEALRRERARKDPYERRARRPVDGPPRPRRRPPRRRGGPSVVAVVAAVVAVAAVGVGGWYGWSALRGGDAAEAAADTLPVLPPLPAELEAAMREVADSAWDDMVDTLRAMGARADLPPEPNPDWLAGIYLANAGDYPDVPAYWDALGDHLDRVRAADEEAFLAAFRTRLLESDAIPPESRDTVVARARAGFRAGAPEREVVYDHLEHLVAAATELHRFLVGNEANITYEPAAGLSRDPVTEAIPSTAALGDEMWDRVGEIPEALEALGTLDRVTTERILEVFHRRLGSVGIR